MMIRFCSALFVTLLMFNAPVARAQDATTNNSAPSTTTTTAAPKKAKKKATKANGLQFHGKLEAVDAKSGKLLWSYDSWRDYPKTVNGVAAHGGAFDAHGPLLAGGQLIVSSGYNSFGQRGGNAFLVFELAPEKTP